MGMHINPVTKPEPIPGTTVFDGEAALKGYALNAMGFSFNDKHSREAFLADEQAYCDRFQLTQPQRAAAAPARGGRRARRSQHDRGGWQNLLLCQAGR